MPIATNLGEDWDNRHRTFCFRVRDVDAVLELNRRGVKTFVELRKLS